MRQPCYETYTTLANPNAMSRRKRTLETGLHPEIHKQ